VNESPSAVNDAIRRTLGWPDAEVIEWVSPLERDDYAEYSDAEFLDCLGVGHAREKLRDFWPVGGPHWDALARTSSGRPIMVEAKAHVAELLSGPSGAGATSLEWIRRSLLEAKAALGSQAKADWSGEFFQYCNRLAHLHFLRATCSCDAFLVSIYFVNAPDVPKAASPAEWQGALELLHSYLGVRHHRLKAYCADVFVDPAVLPGGAV
jgi:hypothetical protein